MDSFAVALVLIGLMFSLVYAFKLYLKSKCKHIFETVERKDFGTSKTTTATRIIEVCTVCGENKINITRY